MVLFVVLLAGACGGDDGGASDTTTTALSATTATTTAEETATTATDTETTSTTATTAPPSQGMTWSRIPHDNAVFGGFDWQEIVDVTVGGPGLVGVGIDASSGFLVAAVWTSPDGTTWSRGPHDEAVLGGFNEEAMWSATVGPPGLVAVGIEGFDQFDAAVWISIDGMSWAQGPSAPAFGGEGDRTMFSVAAGGLGLVAVGREEITEDRDAAVWTSPDGTTWSRVPHDETVFGGENDQQMRDVSWRSSLVAVGSDRSGGDRDAAVWISAEGITWSRVPDNEGGLGGADNQSMLGVAAVSGGLVAVGTHTVEGDSDAAVWTSPDGVTWTRVPHDEAVFGGEDDQSMQSVVGGGPGVSMVGFDESGGDADGAIWLGALG